MRWPTCLWRSTNAELTAWATPDRVVSMSDRRSAMSFRGTTTAVADSVGGRPLGTRFFAMPGAYLIPEHASRERASPSHLRGLRPYFGAPARSHDPTTASVEQEVFPVRS